MSRGHASHENAAAQLECLPALVREARRVRKVSLAVAASQIPYSFADLSRFENGKKDPSLASAINMLRWLSAAYCDSCGAVDTEDSELVRCHEDGNVFHYCEDCYAP